VIGIDGVTRFSFGASSFSLGDFSLAYDSAAQLLSINKNFDVAGPETFYVQAPVFSQTPIGFSLSGDLRIGRSLGAFGYARGADVGFFTLDAVNPTAVPEPSSLALLGVAASGLLHRYRKQRSKLSAQLPDAKQQA
jgi:hypothetical protein